MLSYEFQASLKRRFKPVPTALLPHEKDHIWAPLDPAKREIRLARLAPQKRLGAQAVCSLEILSLDDDPQYEALSYTWGDPDITKPISLQGIQWPVTVNLEAALRYLRDASVEKVTWIDAICINQSSIEERNSQVSLMRHIYRKATLVQVWLGEAAKGSDEAVEVLEEIGRGTPFKDVRIRGKPLNGQHLEHVIDLLARPWWKRVWIQQEFTLAREALLHCGRSSLSQGSILGVPEHADSALVGWNTSEFGSECEKLMNSLNGLNRIRILKQNFKEPATIRLGDFVTILALGRYYTSPDPRDTVYGFLGLANDEIASKIKPNYSDSPLKVLIDSTIEIILNAGSLLPFSLAGIVNDSRGHHPRPSWVPNLSKPAQEVSEEATWSATVNRLAQAELFSACGKRPLVLKVVNDSTAQCSGLYIDRVADKSVDILYLKRLLISREELLERLQARQNFCMTCSSYDITEEDLFWRILTNDIYHSPDDRWRRCNPEDVGAYHAWMKETKTPTRLFGKDQTAIDFNHAIINACTGRRLFATEKGFLGVDPPELEVGDYIYVLAGGNCPYVLRPIDVAERRCTFELVGASYVHGLMDGEGVAHLDADDTCSEGNQPENGFHDVFLI